MSLGQLRDVWMAEVLKQSGPARIDVMRGLSKTTLDIIGLAGAGCVFCFAF